VTEEEQEKLLRDGLLIKDERDGDEVAIPYNIQVETRLSNPHESGLHMVLTEHGKFEKCFIAMHPQGPHGRKNWCTVVRLNGQKNWLNCHPSHVYVAAGNVPGEDGTPNEDLNLSKWLESLPESLPSGKQRFMLVGPLGSATCPVRKDKELGKHHDTTIWEVDCCDDCEWDYAESVLVPDARNEYSFHDDKCYKKHRDGCRIHFNGKEGTTLRSHTGDIHVPVGFKVLTIEPDAGDDDNYTEGHSETPAIRPGNILDRQLDIVTKHSPDYTDNTAPKTESPGKSVLDGSPKDDSPKFNDSGLEDVEEKEAAIRLGTPEQAKQLLKSAMIPLTIWNDGCECEVNRERMSTKAAFIHLVRDHGFRQETARHLMKLADHRRKKTFDIVYPDWWHNEKRALQGPSPFLTDSQPQSVPFPPPEAGSDPFMGSRVPTVFSQEESQVVPSLSGQTDRDIYNPNTERDKTPMDLAQAASGAAQSGQREIFDTAMIGQMLKAVRDDSMVDRYLGDVTKGMDRLGRILFMFYWHGEEFQERYGKQDMPELEDSLRNAFEQVGDVLIFLRQKTVDPYPEEQGFDINSAEGGE
jgi:hypothetical protein